MLILDDDEIATITKKVRPHAQVKVLRALGVEHKVRPDNTLVVSRAHVEHLLGGEDRTTLPSPEPNWGALAKATKTRKPRPA